MPAGRPTEFKPDYVDQVERLARLGVIDEDIADYFGVCVATVNNWKKAHPEFLESIKRGKAVADREVTQKLIDRAMGASWVEDKEVKLKRVWYQDGKKHEEERVQVVALRKSAPPDTPAITFFLKNRRRDLWNEKVELTGANGGPIETHEVSPKEYARRMAFTLRKGAKSPE